MLITLYKIREMLFRKLGTKGFQERQRVKDLLLGARVVARTSNMKISRRRLADYVKILHQKACGTCSTIIFLHSTNQIIDLSLTLPSSNLKFPSVLELIHLDQNNEILASNYIFLRYSVSFAFLPTSMILKLLHVYQDFSLFTI